MRHVLVGEQRRAAQVPLLGPAADAPAGERPVGDHAAGVAGTCSSASPSCPRRCRRPGPLRFPGCRPRTCAGCTTGTVPQHAGRDHAADHQHQRLTSTLSWSPPLVHAGRRNHQQQRQQRGPRGQAAGDDRHHGRAPARRPAMARSGLCAASCLQCPTRRRWTATIAEQQRVADRLVAHLHAPARRASGASTGKPDRRSRPRSSRC